MSLYRRVFIKDHVLLAEMLALRLLGISYGDLTREYEVDKSSIKNWCHKFGVNPKSQTTLRFVIVRKAPNPPAKVYKYQYIFDENDTKNRGKTYLRYIVESRKRFIKSLYVNPPWYKSDVLR